MVARNLLPLNALPLSTMTAIWNDKCICGASSGHINRCTRCPVGSAIHPRAAASRLLDLARRCIPAARHEFSDMEEFVGRKLNAWDVAYYAERPQERRFKVSQEALRPYFPLPKVLKRSDSPTPISALAYAPLRSSIGSRIS